MNGGGAATADTIAKGSSRRTLVRAIGRWALTATVVNSVIGSGIFGLPATLTALAGAWSPLVVLAAGASIFVIVLCFAEVGSRFDEPGGPYLYARTAFGNAVGFQVGWLHILTRLLSGAAVLNVLIAYLGALLPWVATPAGRAATMIIAVTTVTALNIAGVRQAAWTVNVFTVAKLLPLLALAVLGGIYFRPEVLATQIVADPKWTEALLLLVFAYGGFESSVVAGSESRDPRRDTAFALLVAMLGVTAIYCLVQVAVVGVLPSAATSTAPVASVFREMFGPVGATVGSLAVVISVYGWLSGFALMTPRILFAMAERRELPAFLARVHHRFRTPYLAILINSGLALALGLAGSFAQMAAFAAISRLAIYISTCGALLILRRKLGEPEGFRVPGGRGVAVIGIAFCLWLITTRSLAQAWFLPVVMAVGAATWALAEKARKRDGEAAID